MYLSSKSVTLKKISFTNLKNKNYPEIKKPSDLEKLEFVSFTKYFYIVGSTPPNTPHVYTNNIHKTEIQQIKIFVSR